MANKMIFPKYINLIIQFSIKVKCFIQLHFEVLFWVTGLVSLFFMQPAPASASLCIFSSLGIPHCPGCGLGHAIQATLHGNFTAAYYYHPLGTVAVFIIFYRIKQLIFTPKTRYHDEQFINPDPFNRGG